MRRTLEVLALYQVGVRSAVPAVRAYNGWTPSMSAHTSGDAAPDLAIDLGQLHELLLESEDISAFLTDFTAVMSRRLSAGGNEIWCAVNLLRQRKAATVASSDPRAKDLDETQNRFLDGPCLTAMREQRLIRADDMSTDTRWPGYAAAAVEQGIGSILGIPFDLGEEAQAGLNIYCDRAYAFDADTIEMVQHDVALASKGVRLAVRLARHQEAETDLRTAMASRTTIDLAVGIIMGQNRCGQEEAFEILKAVSNHRNVKLRQIAADLVTSVANGPAATHFEG